MIETASDKSSIYSDIVAEEQGLNRTLPVKDFRDAGIDLSMEALAARILVRHQATIRVKKAQVATVRLARIVTSTLSLANNSSFHSMSLRDLSEHSGLSMGALYAYFDSKDTLLLMILDTVSSVVEEVLGNPPSDLGSPILKLRWLLSTHVQLTEVMLPWFIFSFMEAKTFPSQARGMAVASERRTEKLIADILAEGCASAAFSVADVQMTAALIKPMLQDWYVKRSKYRRRKITPEVFAESLIMFVENAILSDVKRRA